MMFAVNCLALLNKSDVAQSFNQAAKTYDSAAELQQLVGERLFEYLPEGSCSNLMDLGCGTGFFTKILQDRYPGCVLHSVDLAEGMVRHAHTQNQAVGTHYYCGDAEQLPLRNASVELIYSNLSLQWCPDFSRALSEAWRVLVPGGQLVMSTLGPETLHELRSAWQQVDNYVHVNSFVGLASINTFTSNVGFQSHAEEQMLIMTYNHLRELTHELKAIGAHNINSGRPMGLTGKQRVRKLLVEYERFRNESGSLPATYQVYYLCLTKP